MVKLFTIPVFLYLLLALFGCSYQTAYKCDNKLNDRYYKTCQQKVLKQCKNPSVIKNKLYCEVN